MEVETVPLLVLAVGPTRVHSELRHLGSEAQCRLKLVSRSAKRVRNQIRRLQVQLSRCRNERRKRELHIVMLQLKVRRARFRVQLAQLEWTCEIARRSLIVGE